MFGFKRKSRNRRLWRRQDVLEVKVRSKVARAARTRLAAISLGVVFGTLFGLYAVWRLGEWTLDQLVYDNKSFAIQQVDVHTDGVISPEQLRQWTGVRPGQNLLALDLARVKHDLENWPMIKSASVERVLPETLRVRVVEREPVAQVTVLQPREGGGIDQRIFYLDAEAFVLQPLDPRQRAVPLGQASDQLPAITGLNPMELQPGRRLESVQLLAALRLIAEFEQSPMGGLVDLRRIDVSAPQVLVVNTVQGSEITFAQDNFEKQLARWWKVHEQCVHDSKSIASLDLAVSDYLPLRVQAAGAPPPPPLKNHKPSKTKKKNV
ncbi:MAG: FtsQ-type POTRA domain-containing protein [Verrucomicrobiota bacterium]